MRARRPGRGQTRTVWIFLWHYNVFVATVPVMVALLLTLIAIYVRLGIGVRPARSRAETWAVRLPWSVYLAWITIATIANISITLLFLGWDGFGLPAEAWAVAVLAVGVAIAVANALTRRDVAFGLVIVWAYVGIVVRQADTPSVVATAAIGAMLVGLLALRSLLLALRAGDETRPIMKPA